MKNKMFVARKPSPPGPSPKGRGEIIVQFAICNLQLPICNNVNSPRPSLRLRPRHGFAAGRAIFRPCKKAFDSASKPEEFVKVAAMYQELLEPPNRFISGEVYYDLGNAWMRAKQPGRAIAAYRQAERYLPAIRI